MAEPPVMLSFDVEEWFQSENYHGIIPRDVWTTLESRVERNTRDLLDLLESNGQHATFFLLGWVAERHRGLVHEIARRGHEIASHGYDHELIYRQTPAQFRHDITRTRCLLEDISGGQVYGYRAPVFSITDWAVEHLIAAGYTYDSSLFPVTYHDRYGTMHYPGPHTRVPRINNRLYEVILPTLEVLGLSLPWAGGGYFRLLPYSLFRLGINLILRRHACYLFYFHPHELDPAQPRVRLANPLLHCRQYLGLSHTPARIRRLFSEYRFTTIADGLRTLGFDVRTRPTLRRAA